MPSRWRPGAGGHGRRRARTGVGRLGLVALVAASLGDAPSCRLGGGGASSGWFSASSASSSGSLFAAAAPGGSRYSSFGKWTLTSKSPSAVDANIAMVRGPCFFPVLGFLWGLWGKPPPLTHISRVCARSRRGAR
jgi:hypothetical protein